MPRPLSKARQHKQLLSAVRDGDAAGVERLCSAAEPIGALIVDIVFKHPDALCAQIVNLVLPYINQRQRQDAFKYAVLCNQPLVFELVLPTVNPQHNFSEALRAAAREGVFDMVKRLLPISDQRVMDYIPLKEAAQNWQWPVVNFLIEHVNAGDLPQPVLKEIICGAAENKQVNLLCLALPFYSAKLDTHYIVNAASHGRTDIVDVLYPYSDMLYAPRMLQVYLEREQIAYEDYCYLLHYSDHLTHKKITQEVDALGQSSRARKM